MSPEKQRRKALKKLLAGTGAAGVVAVAPKKWSAPVIDSVIMPAHAVTTSTTTAEPLSLNYGGGTVTAALTPAFLLDHLISTAHATSDLEITGLCINFNGDMKTFKARVETKYDPLFTATGTVGVAVPLWRNCDSAERYALTLANGPGTDGIPWVVAPISDAWTGGGSGTAQASECVVDVNTCLD